MSAVLSTDIEREFVNHLLTNSLEKIISEGFSEDLLINQDSRRIFAFARNYFTQSKQIPPISVLKTEFEDYEFEEPVASIEWTLDKLRERYKKNKIWDIAIGLGNRQEDVEDAVDFLRKSTLDLDSKISITKDIWKTSDYDKFIDLVNADIISGQYRGFSTGFKMIDIYIGGLKPGYLTFLAARPKKMKSFFLLQSFIEQIKQGHNPILFTLELTHKEVMLRFMCMVTGYPWDKAQRGDFTPNDWKYIKKRWQEFIDQYGTGTIIQPPIEERTVQQLLLLADKHDADSIFISQFKYIQSNKKYRDFYQAYPEIVLDLKLAATKSGYERPIYVECQLNREAQNVAELAELDSSQLGLSDAIPQNADLLFGIVQSNDMRNSQMAEMGIIEARNSQSGIWIFETEFKTDTFIRCREQK